MTPDLPKLKVSTKLDDEQGNRFVPVDGRNPTG
jgi:hypothetical protein